jgi:hypothetical protein
MTMPHERFEAVALTREFLDRLLYPHKTPRVPQAVREEARRLLRHYPVGIEMRWVWEGRERKGVRHLFKKPEPSTKP